MSSITTVARKTTNTNNTKGTDSRITSEVTINSTQTTTNASDSETRLLLFIITGVVAVVIIIVCIMILIICYLKKKEKENSDEERLSKAKQYLKEKKLQKTKLVIK